MHTTISNRRINKKEQIVHTAETLFTRYESKRVTVEEICRLARVSKMTFYKHFSNKVELIKEGTWTKVFTVFSQYSNRRAPL